MCRGALLRLLQAAAGRGAAVRGYAYALRLTAAPAASGECNPIHIRVVEHACPHA